MIFKKNNNNINVNDINNNEKINYFIEKKTFGLEGIYHFIPQREPFLMVDSVLDIDIKKQKIVCEKQIRNDEWYLKGHFPKNPVMPGVLIVETMAQSSSIIAKAIIKDTNEIFLLAEVEDVKFKSICKPGDKLIIEVIVEKIRSSLMVSKCVVKNQDNIIIAEGRIKAFKKKI